VIMAWLITCSTTGVMGKPKSRTALSLMPPPQVLYRGSTSRSSSAVLIPRLASW